MTDGLKIDAHVKITFDKNAFQNLTDTALMQVANQSAQQFSEQLRKDIPKKSGNLANSVEVIPSQKIGDKIIAVVTVGNKTDAPYAYALWKGIARGTGINGIITPKNGEFLIFHERDWKNYDSSRPDAPKPNRRGLFYLKKVKRYMPPNKFIERAIANFEKTIGTKISVTFGNLMK